MFNCSHGRPSGSCLICATNESVAATNAQRDELQQMRQEMQTAADLQRQLAEKQLELNMTTHWETHLTREAVSKGLDPAEFVRAARSREQQQIATAQNNVEEAKKRLLGAASVRNSISIGVLSGPAAGMIRAFIGGCFVIAAMTTNFLGALLGLLVGAAVGAGWIAYKRSGMEETSRIVGVALAPPLWSMVGAAATGAAWVSAFAYDGPDGAVTLIGPICVLYVPITFAIRALIKKRNPFVAAAEVRVVQAANALADTEDHLAAVNRHPAVKYGLVAA